MTHPKQFIEYTTKKVLESVESNLLTTEGMTTIIYFEKKRTELEVREV